MFVSTSSHDMDEIPLYMQKQQVVMIQEYKVVCKREIQNVVVSLGKESLETKFNIDYEFAKPGLSNVLLILESLPLKVKSICEILINLKEKIKFQTVLLSFNSQNKVQSNSGYSLTIINQTVKIVQNVEDYDRPLANLESRILAYI